MVSGFVTPLYRYKSLEGMDDWKSGRLHANQANSDRWQSANLPHPLDGAAEGMTLPFVCTSGQLDTVGKA